MPDSYELVDEVSYTHNWDDLSFNDEFKTIKSYYDTKTLAGFLQTLLDRQKQVAKIKSYNWFLPKFADDNYCHVPGNRFKPYPIGYSITVSNGACQIVKWLICKYDLPVTNWPVSYSVAQVNFLGSVKLLYKNKIGYRNSFNLNLTESDILKYTEFEEELLVLVNNFISKYCSDEKVEDVTKADKPKNIFSVLISALKKLCCK